MVPGNRGQTPLVLATISSLCLWRGEQVPQCRKSFAKEVIPVLFKIYPKINLQKWCILFREKEAKKREHALVKSN